MNNKNYKNRTSSTSKPWAPKPEKTAGRTGYYYGDGLKNSNTKNSTTASKTRRVSFTDALEKTRSAIYDLTLTTNGAVAHSTSGSKLLDLNFAVGSLRGKTEKEIYSKFRAAFNENPVYAMRWLFYARDVREGLGERNLFRVCVKDMAKNNQHELISKLVPLMAEYGRWDDVLELLNTKSKNSVLKTIQKQFTMDLVNLAENKPISLMAKWLPSEQASNSEAKRQAYMIMKYLHMSPSQYRKNLSMLRKYIDVVERKMSSDNWQAIDYEAVPSKANLLYKKAFLKHDFERRSLYLDALNKGTAKINSSVAFPHDIIHKYLNGSRHPKSHDSVLESMWSSLPNTVGNNNSTIVVADGSGSMLTNVGGTKITAIEVANALAIYFAERCQGEFKNKYITFSETPKLVNLGNNSLKDKLTIASKHCEMANTNIEAVFQLILKTARMNKMCQEEIPQNIVIISDMQFDSCAVDNSYVNRNSTSWYSYRTPSRGLPKTLFDNIKESYEAAGYKMPKLIFWNVNSPNSAIPMRENELGVTLVSGFSVNVCKAVMNNKTDPYEALIDTISNKRYNAIEDVMRKIAK